MIESQIFNNPKKKEISQIKEASSQDVETKLGEWFNRCLMVDWIDDEMLEYAGLAVGKSGHENIDKFVMNWLNIKQSESLWKCWKIVAGFLIGYWKVKKVTDYKYMHTLIDVLNDMSIIESEAYPVIVLALYNVIVSKHAGLTNQEIQYIRGIIVSQGEVIKQTIYCNSSVADLIATLKKEERETERAYYVLSFNMPRANSEQIIEQLLARNPNIEIKMIDGQLVKNIWSKEKIIHRSSDLDNKVHSSEKASEHIKCKR